MLVYRSAERRADTRREIARLLAHPGAAAGCADDDATLGWLIGIAELEAAIADALCPERDTTTALLDSLRASVVDAARCWRGTDRGARDRTLQALLELDPDAVPDAVALRVSEGYAYYALYPETYIRSAQRFAHERRPQRVTVIGIRSIGASLSAVVSAALAEGGCEVRSCTVRPHGHPFDRRLAIDEPLAAALRADAARGSLFAVVDEGPGISGSSFASVAEALRDLGIPARDIVLFPSWDPDPSRLRSERARHAWSIHPRYCTTARDAGITPDATFGIGGPVVEFSAGAWRASLYATPENWPAAHPQHERWKVLLPDERRLLKFAGLGDYGVLARDRAEALADLAIGPPPGVLRRGFLDLPFVDGWPMPACATATDAAAIGRYIGRVARAFPHDTAADTASLFAMIEVNVGSLIGAIPTVDLPEHAPAALIDGRMLAHEWIRDGGRLRKVDALDHGNDHFFPGPQSPAWDLTAASIELWMDEALQGAMLAAYVRESGDRTAGALMPFYALAYAAFRYGYADLAVETLAGTDEAARFERERARYSQCALNAAACLTAASKSPRKQIARSSMKT